MARQILGRDLPLLALLLFSCLACTKSVCETKRDCPADQTCSSGACVPACLGDGDCALGQFCETKTGLCKTGCNGDSDCGSGEACLEHKCWPVSSPLDGGTDDGGSATCRCLRAPSACLHDINPASASVGRLVCEPGSPPRPTAFFFGNVGCSHCQIIFSNLLLIENQLRSEGFTPTLIFAQLKDSSPTEEAVSSTFPTHNGPVLQDTPEADLWAAYGADWYQVKMVDGNGCLSAFFAAEETQNLIADGQLQTQGKLVKEAWIAAMGSECHGPPDAGSGNGT